MENLLATVSLEAIQETNKEVSAAVEVTEQGNRMPNKHIGDALKESIGWYALKMAAVWKYSDDFDAALKESTVQPLKKCYIVKEKQVKMRIDYLLWSLVICYYLVIIQMNKVKGYINASWPKECVVNTPLVILQQVCTNSEEQLVPWQGNS